MLNRSSNTIPNSARARRALARAQAEALAAVLVMESGEFRRALRLAQAVEDIAPEGESVEDSRAAFAVALAH